MGRESVVVRVPDEDLAMALAMVGGITLLDLATANEVGARHASQNGSRRMYYDRTGYPKGMAASRGIAAGKKGAPQLAAS